MIGEFLISLFATLSLSLSFSESLDLSLGASVQLEGKLVASTHPKQPVELVVSTVNVLGSCDNNVRS